MNKIDLAAPHIDKDRWQRPRNFWMSRRESIFRVSAKTGEGVKELLDAVVKQCRRRARRGSGSRSHESCRRALIFDSLYDDHKGIIAFVRVFGGEFKAEDMEFIATGARFKAKEVGYFSPDLEVAPEIKDGEIGYIATGLKEPALVKIGDTVLATEREAMTAATRNDSRLPGYREPAPVVFISFYPDGETKFDDLKSAFEKLRLNDAALTFEPDANEALGRGLKVGFLGQLHFEITSSRLEREYNLEFLTSFPSIAYRVQEQRAGGRHKTAAGFSGQAGKSLGADRRARNPRAAEIFERGRQFADGF